jgi:hypothetical protein
VSEARAAGVIIDGWWIRGQPAIDWIRARLRVDRESLGSTVETLASLHSVEQQVNLVVFPLGLPKPEQFQLGVVINRNMQKIPG